MENKQSITIEETQYEFITDGFLRPTAPIRRFSQGGKRFYYKVLDDGSISLYSSATTLIKDGYAEDTIFLEEWRNRLKAEGKDPAYELSFLAMRGTLLHILAGDFIQQKVINLVDLNQYFSLYHPSVTTEYLYNEVIQKDSLWLQKGLMAFSVWCSDYKVKPLAIELILASEKYQVASPVDLICELTITEKGLSETEVYKSGPRKGEPKEVKVEKTILAVVDLKSSKAFFDKHFFQLQLYKQIVEENYPNLKVEGLFNWSPKEWTGTTPSYNFKDQLEGNASLLPLCEPVFTQGMLKHKNKEPKVEIVPETIQFGQEFKYDKVLLTEFLKNHHGQRSTEGK